MCHFSSMKSNFRVIFTKLIHYGAIVQKEKRRNAVFFIPRKMTLKTIIVVTFDYLMNVKKTDAISKLKKKTTLTN